MTYSADDIIARFSDSVAAAPAADEPYRHWFLENSIPADAVTDIAALPLEAPDLVGISGKRELHNKTRQYCDTDNQGKFHVAGALAQAFQDKQTTNQVEEQFQIDLAGSYLRIEFAQDTDGFWLEPHTDLGVKLFTMLLYVSGDASHKGLGTDIYHQDKTHAGRSPFAPGGAMVFVPSDITYHGFEPRPIEGVRKSVIINYVTAEWRAREQLAFPDQPIS